MGGTTNKKEFVAVHLPHNYFHCQYLLARVVVQGPALAAPDHFLSNLCHIPLKSRALVAYHIAL